MMAKDKLFKDETRSRDFGLLALGILVVVIVVYYNCGFADYGYAPDRCNVTEGEAPEDEEEPLSCSNPGLNQSLQEFNPLTYAVIESSCANWGGEWIETETVVGCQLDLDPNSSISIDCNNWLENDDISDMVVECDRLGNFHCQEDAVFCWCTGSGPLPYDPMSARCDYQADFSGGELDTYCGGYCEGLVMGGYVQGPICEENCECKEMFDKCVCEEVA
jgi:hypothetical protein